MKAPEFLAALQTAANTSTSQVTQTVRAGIECGDPTGCVIPPLHLSSTFAFRGFADKGAYDYTRSGNPTRDLLAAALAELELYVRAGLTPPRPCRRPPGTGRASRAARTSARSSPASGPT